MSEKVMITQAQADAIDTLKNKFDGVRYTDLFDALKYGYEVEPEYKHNEWIVVTGKHHGNCGKVLKIKEIKKSCAAGEKYAYFLDDKSVRYVNEIRHATESEISQEKERRFWSKRGRDVKEYRKGDLFVTHDGELYEVTKFEPNQNDEFDHPVRFVNKSGRDDGYMREAKLKVVCFAEDRLDYFDE